MVPVLAITSSRTTRRQVSRSLAAAGIEAEFCASDCYAVELALARGPRLCIVDLSGPAETINTIISRVREKGDALSPVFLSRGNRLGALRDTLLTDGSNNLIAKHTGDELIDENELIVTCHKLLQHHDIFGLEKYLSNRSVKIHRHSIESTDAKDEAILAFEDYLHRIDCYRSVMDAALLVADELMMNALFNAPRNSQGEAKYAHLDRGTPLVLGSQEEARFKYGCDGRSVVLSVMDRFGSLSSEVIRQHIEHSLDGTPAAMRHRPTPAGPHSSTGAGLGLHMVFCSVTQLVFNVRPGYSTEVIAIFYARSGSVAFRASGRSLNLFIQNGHGLPE